MFTQEDFEGLFCPECGGKIVYEFGTARCENGDWMCEDTELQDLVDANYAAYLESKEDAEFPPCPTCGARVTHCFTTAHCTNCAWAAVDK